MQLKELKGVIFSLAVIFLSSCCVSQKTAERRIARYVECNPGLLNKDTVIVKDTVFLDAVSVDTTFSANTTDTIIIEKDKVRIVYIKKDTTIYLRGEIIRDTIPIEIPVEVEKIVVKENPYDKFIPLLYILLFIGILVALRKLFK